MSTAMLGGDMFTNNLDIDEYVNYLLSGSFFVAMMASFNYPLMKMVAPLVSSNGSLLGTAPLWIGFIVMAVFLGHVFSMLARYLVRPVINWFFGDPELAILPLHNTRRACSDFFTDELRSAIAKKFADVFEIPLDNESIRRSVPRLIRTFVLHNSTSAAERREAVIRPRSFTANLAVAFCASSLITLEQSSWQAHLILWAGAGLLIVKQRSLDEREAKEIYTHFLVVK